MGEFDQVREQLEARLVQLDDRVSRIQRNLRRPGSRDSQELATERENEEVLEQLDEVETRELAEIRAALTRIDTGGYGTCERCGQAIGEKRLAALPFASSCIGCAE